MDFDIEKFKKNLKNKTKITFEKCLEKLSKDEICGFALYSDNSAMTISISLNTYSHLKALREEEPGYDQYFRWTPGEWKYEMINSNEFEELNDLLDKAHVDVTEVQFLEYRNSVYNTAVEILEEMKNEGLFAGMKNDFILMFAVSDFSEPKLEIEYVSRLNNEQKNVEFREWIESETAGD